MAQDREAFNALFATHFIPLVRFVERRTGSTHVGEDIASSTLEDAWKAMARRDDIGAAWLYRVAYNKLADHFDTSRRRLLADAALERLASEPPSGLSTIDRLALEEALQRLGARERQVVVLTYWDGLSAEEIGAILSRKPGAILTMLSRARGKLREMLHDREGRTIDVAA